ncbi:hypothetical protein [Sphingobacterium sp. FBM7-1]|uniref:hypothetical protein n=1 Tax=Sphingobacterium sp. FBM7-1 TaxID=2886688 RepID=UPI001D10D500|nr:hypothetical protein [Sphingobacterium sp. FBM7-1]MCC2599682.1 hypothetical protein [Sphingobacterium sp. FBM7-1]
MSPNEDNDVLILPDGCVTLPDGSMTSPNGKVSWMDRSSTGLPIRETWTNGNLQRTDNQRVRKDICLRRVYTRVIFHGRSMGENNG